MDQFNPDADSRNETPTTEQTPHSGVHNDEFPVREYNETTLKEATTLPDFKSKLPTNEVVTVASFTGQSPETVEVIPEVPSPATSTEVETEKKKPNLGKRIAWALGGVGAAGAVVAGAILGPNLANPDKGHDNTPKPDDKATNQPSTPSPEQTTGAGEKDNAEIEALIATMDNEARTNPEAFMQRPLSERLLIRDKYKTKVADNAVAWAINADHFVVNEKPNLDNDGQTIVNNLLISELGLGRGFIAEPSDANGNKWTQDYTLGESFVSADRVLDSTNPNAEDLKFRITRGLDAIKGADVDFAPINDDIVAQSEIDGEPVVIEGQECPTKIIEAVVSGGSAIDKTTFTMAFFKYKDAQGKEKAEWVTYKIVNHQ